LSRYPVFIFMMSCLIARVLSRCRGFASLFWSCLLLGVSSRYCGLVSVSPRWGPVSMSGFGFLVLISSWGLFWQMRFVSLWSCPRWGFVPLLWSCLLAGSSLVEDRLLVLVLSPCRRPVSLLGFHLLVVVVLSAYWGPVPCCSRDPESEFTKVGTRNETRLRSPIQKPEFPVSGARLQLGP